jgi:hypothetical protein
LGEAPQRMDQIWKGENGERENIYAGKNSPSVLIYKVKHAE